MLKKIIGIIGMLIGIIALGFISATPVAGNEMYHLTPTPRLYHYTTCTGGKEFACVWKVDTEYHTNTCEENSDCKPILKKDCDGDYDNSSVDEDQKCKITPTPTVTPTITPTPTASPSATPTVTPTTAPTTGTSTNDNSVNQTPGSPSCTIKFDSPLLQGFSVLGRGKVNFSWWGVSGVDHYSIIYGYDKDQLNFGQDKVFDTNVTINGLEPKNHVWAKVYAWKGQCASISNELDPVVR